MTCADNRDQQFDDERWLWLDEAPDADDLDIIYGPDGPHLWRGRVWVPITDVHISPVYQHAI